MEENTQLPKEVVDKIEQQAHDAAWSLYSPANYNEFTSYQSGYTKGATAYATKLHLLQQKHSLLEDAVRVLTYDNNRLKGEVEEEKRQHELSVKSLRYSLDQREAKLNDANKLLDEVFRKHETGLLPDRFIYDKIKMFLYGE